MSFRKIVQREAKKQGISGYRLAKMVGPEGKVLGVDIQPQMLEMLSARAKEANIENIEPGQPEQNVR